MKTKISKEAFKKVLNLVLNAAAEKHPLTPITAIEVFELDQDVINLTETSRELGASFRELEKIGVISDLVYFPLHSGTDGHSYGGTYQMKVHSRKGWDVQSGEQESDGEFGEVSKPEVVAEKGIGYLKFAKHGKRIEIGSAKTRKFRLLVSLIDPLGTNKTIESVFDAIRLPKDRKDSRLKDEYVMRERMTEIMKLTIKDLQKIKGLTGKIKLIFTSDKKSVRLSLGV
jgi:hypothetical protein